MAFSESGEQQQDVATLDRRCADRVDVAVPILRAGVLARRFCEGVAFANVEAVFQRCFYLRSGEDFVCVGDTDIGNGPTTLSGDLGALPSLEFLAGQVALIRGASITIGTSVRLALDRTELWRPLSWPACPPPDCLIDICAALASRVANAAPHEGFARCVIAGGETSGCLPLARVARPRIATFERWLSGMLRATPRPASRQAVGGLIGLGPGLTPSGDDFLIGALSVLDAIGEIETHAAMARAIVDTLPGLTTPLSACFLRAAGAGHVSENLHQVVSSVMTGDVDEAVAVAGKIGHSSGWDMIASILTALSIAATRRRAPAIQAVARS